MEEIKVGEYVRTKNGAIFRAVSNIVINENIPKKLKKLNDTILKHSPNIIDLIEVGDYVNGMEVLEIYTPRDLWEPIEIRVDSRYMNYLTSEEIKTIVTKEQFKNVMYEV